MNNNKFSKIQNLVIGSISSLSMIGIYTGSVNLSRNANNNQISIFIGGTILAYITPHITYNILVKRFKNYNEQKAGDDINE